MHLLPQFCNLRDQSADKGEESRILLDSGSVGRVRGWSNNDWTRSAG